MNIVRRHIMALFYLSLQLECTHLFGIYANFCFLDFNFVTVVQTGSKRALIWCIILFCQSKINEVTIIQVLNILRL